MAITDPLCRSFLDLWWHFNPAAATLAGVPGNDDRLGAFDAGSIREHVAALRSIAGAVEDQDVEETADEIDRTALLDHVRVLVFRLEREQPHRRNPVLWIDHACQALHGLLVRGPDDPSTAPAALSRLRSLPRFLADARETLRAPPGVLVEAALAQLDALRDLVEATGRRHGLSSTLSGGDGSAVLAEAEAAVDRMRLALRSEIPADPDPHAAAIGEEEVDRRLHYEHASLHNAAEVWRASLGVATEIEREATALAASIDPARTWRDVYNSVLDRAGPPDDLPALYRSALISAQRFAELRGLAAPGDLPPVVEPAPVHIGLLEPVASYSPAGALAPASLWIEGGDRPAIPWLAARLGIPGMHLHHSRSDAQPGLVRSQIAASSTASGWGLYAEELLRELGYSAEPESRLAERVLALGDAHLAVVDLGIHTRQLTPEEAVGHLSTRLPIERATAEAHVRRVACHPTSACAATLGRAELRRLRDDARAARGAEFDLTRFHEDVFSYGGLPVPLIRWGMDLDV